MYESWRNERRRNNSNEPDWWIHQFLLTEGEITDEYTSIYTDFFVFCFFVLLPEQNLITGTSKLTCKLHLSVRWQRDRISKKVKSIPIQYKRKRVGGYGRNSVNEKPILEWITKCFYLFIYFPSLSIRCLRVVT